MHETQEEPLQSELHHVTELPARAAAPPDQGPLETPHHFELHIAPEPVEPLLASMPSDIFLAPEAPPHVPDPPAQKAEHPHTLDDLYTPPGRPPRTTVPLPADRFIASEQTEVSPEPPAPPVQAAPVPSPSIAAQSTPRKQEEPARLQLVETPLPAPVPAPKDDFSEWDDIHLRGAQPVKQVKPSAKFIGKTKSAKREMVSLIEDLVEPVPKPTRAEKAEQRAMFREIAAEDGVRTPRDKKVWILIGAVPVALAAVLTLLFWHPAHPNTPAPAPVQYVVPPATTSAVPDAAAPSAATPQPASATSKPSPSAPTLLQVDASTVPSRSKAVSPDAMDAQLNAPSRISPEMKRSAPAEEAPAGFTPVSMEGGAAPVLGTSKQVNVVPVASRVSAGVAQGLLLRKIDPVYPPMAKTSRVSGTVVLACVITKSGSIADLHVVSGPAMLRQAALDAVKQWRYRPYMLNNQPVEVETNVSVVFNLSN